MEDFAYGVDLGWVSQLESQGYVWENSSGSTIDPIQAAKECGADSVRLRVFVNPPEDAHWTKKNGETCMLGFCAAEDVLAVSRRVQALGMRLMIDFHYSDHFADPQYQDIPAMWKRDSIPGLTRRVYQHTKEVLTLLKANGITPEWAQVGNEINSGILLPVGSSKDGFQNLVGFLNAGYEAVKEIFPTCEVVTHMGAGHVTEYVERFMDTFFQLNGKTDMIGLSYYPYWFNLISDKLKMEPVIPTEAYLFSRLERYFNKYKLPIMICEIGELDSDDAASYSLLDSTIKALKRMPEGVGAGLFYWEPEVNSEVLPDHYPLGAARYLGSKKLQYTKALCAYRDNKN